MKKEIRILIGVLCFLQLIAFLNGLAYFFWQVPLFFMDVLWLSYLLGIILTFLFVYFFYLLFQVPTLGYISKLLWAVRFFLIAPVAMFIFWYYFILHREEYAEFSEEEELGES